MPEFDTNHDLSAAARQQRGRIWVDGCFDFAHHGHAGAMLQARQLGTELWVGIHSDEAITTNKGPTVMDLGERIAAVDACRWATASVGGAPYVTELAFIDGYGAHFVAHGDDITSDAGGEDSYRWVKGAGRMLIVRRTPGISTTDLVGRMLVGSRSHHVRSLAGLLDGSVRMPDDAAGSPADMRARLGAYASDASGLEPCVQVWACKEEGQEVPSLVGGARNEMKRSDWELLVPGIPPKPGQRVVYADGGFDLFSSGHIEFLKQVERIEEERARELGWFDESNRKERERASGADYAPAYVVAGVHGDAAVNRAKGANYPIMNVFERGLCVLQCKYVHAVLFNPPYVATRDVLTSLPFDTPVAAVYHGPAASEALDIDNDPYAAAKEMGVFAQVPPHAYQDVNARQIVRRIMASRERYEERQRKKGVKAVGEAEARQRELELEQQQKQQ